MESITLTIPTQPTGIRPAHASGLVMSDRPTVATLGCVAVDGVTKGHVGFAAYIPGPHAWSPPLC